MPTRAHILSHVLIITYYYSYYYQSKCKKAMQIDNSLTVFHHSSFCINFKRILFSGMRVCISSEDNCNNLSSSMPLPINTYSVNQRPGTLISYIVQCLGYVQICATYFEA